MSSSAQEVTLLGLCDGQLDPRRHYSSFLTNKVGGEPDWPPVVSGPSPRCGGCGAPSVHVVQVYCPLDTSPYHRNLHLFACPAAECSGRPESWTVLRSQCLEAAAQTRGRPLPAQDAPLSATDWCDTADDWGTEKEKEVDGWGGGGGGVKDAEVQDEAAAGKERVCVKIPVTRNTPK